MTFLDDTFFEERDDLQEDAKKSFVLPMFIPEVVAVLSFWCLGRKSLYSEMYDVTCFWLVKLHIGSLRRPANATGSEVITVRFQHVKRRLILGARWELRATLHKTNPYPTLKFGKSWTQTVPGVGRCDRFQEGEPGGLQVSRNSVMIGEPKSYPRQAISAHVLNSWPYEFHYEFHTF